MIYIKTLELQFTSSSLQTISGKATFIVKLKCKLDDLTSEKVPFHFFVQINKLMNSLY